MTPADSHRLLSDEDPPIPWSYRYSTPEEYLALKQEPEWDEDGESEAASWAMLYADHDVKEEIVFGPEQFQLQDIAMSMQNMLIKTEEDPGTLNLADEVRTEYEDTPTLSGDQTDQTLQQLAHSYVRLEHTALEEQNTSSSSLTDKSFQCNICHRQFAGQAYLTNHIKSHKDHSCHICLRKFSLPCYLAKHMKKHEPKPYSCNLCNKIFTKSSKLVAHMIDHKVSKPYHCNICQGQYKDKKSLSNHKYANHPHSETKQYFCKICLRRFVYRGSLIAHNIYHHTNDKLNDNSINKLPQEPSNVESNTSVRNVYEKDIKKLGLRLHWKSTLDHTVPRPYSCNICQSQYSIKQSLYTHKYLCHWDDTETKPHSCKICERRFVYRKTLLTHMQIRHPKENEQLANTQSHGNEKPLCCDVCQKRFLYRKTLITHIRLRHPQAKEELASSTPSSKLIERVLDQTAPRRYCCDICQGQYKNKQSLATHKYTRHPDHTKKKPHSCKICQRRFRYRKTLLSHMQMRHPKSKEELASSAPSSKLIEHMLDHTVPKPYCCNICQGQFKNRKSLHNHKYKRHSDHIETKPHSCKICERRFVYRKTLLTHMQMRHPKENEQLANTQSHGNEKPLCCNVCQKRFLYKKTLITHIRLRHPQAKEELASSTPSSKLIERKLDQTAPRRYCCDICQGQYKNKQSLATHKYTRHPDHTKKKPHSCKICQRRFRYRKTLLTHMQMRHPKSKEELASSAPSSKLIEHMLDHTVPKPYCCNICQGQFKNRKSLHNHKYKRHSDHIETKPHSCKICERRFVYRKTLLTHMQMRHPKENEQLANTQSYGNEKPLCCDVCQKRFLYKKTLITHIRLRHPQAKEELASSTPSSKLIERMLDQTAPRPYCCDICQGQYKNKQSLATHKYKRHPDHTKAPRRYCCNICQGQYKNKQSLATHKYKRHPDHTKMKPHSCKICQRHFLYRKTLLTHMQMRHPKAKEELASSAPCKLIEPMIDHTVPKPYCCNICQGQFKNRKSLYNHKYKHHSDHTKAKPHSCKICSKRFVFKSGLIAHKMYCQNNDKLNENSINKLTRQSSSFTKPIDNNMKQKSSFRDINNIKTVKEQISHTHNLHLHGKDNIERGQMKGNPHCCSICQKRFVYRKSLVTHMRRRHQKSNESGKQLARDQDITEEQFHEKENESNIQEIIPSSNTTNQEQDQTKEKPHYCTICQQRFVYQKSLVTHMRKHPGSKPDAQLTQSSSLDEEKHCRKGFVYRKNLRTHMRIRDQKAKEQLATSTPSSKLNESKLGRIVPIPHSCNICHSKFRVKQSLATHKYLCHWDDTETKPHYCKICERRFVYRKTVLRHMRMLHPETKEELASSTPASKLSERTLVHTAPRPYRCDICQGQYKNKQSLACHKYKRHWDHTKTKPHSCKICERRFVHRKSLLTHLQMRHPKENKQLANTQNHKIETPHCCTMCQTRFVHSKSLRTHMRTRHPKADENLANTQSHGNEKPHSCNVCQKRFLYEKSLLTHLRISHPKAIQKLTRFTPSSKLIERMRNHPVSKPYCCHICQGRFKTRGSLYSHKYKHHSDHTSTEVKPHSCKVCQKRFVYRKTLVTHMRRRHPKENEQLANTQSHGSEKPYCCDNCQKRFVYKKTLITHMRRRHQKSNETKNNPALVESGKQLARDQDLTKEQFHEKANESTNQEIIPSSNSTNQDQDQTKEKPHCCTICQQRFVYQKSLVTHMRKHPGSKPDAQLTQSSSLDEQKHCQKGFVDRKNLRTHMRIRDQKAEEQLATSTPSSKLNESKLGRIVPSPYSCNICHSKFRVKQSLATHKYLCHWDDTETKPHSCKICQRRFVYRKAVFRHMRMLHPETKEELASSTPASKLSERTLDHTVPRPYCCDICQGQYKNKQSLATHKYKCHLDRAKTKPHSCKICQRRFLYRQTLSTHMQLLHPKAKKELASSTPASKLTERILDHTVPKPYSCDICQGQFKNQQSLSSHKYKMHSDHTETKPHSCEICQRRFVYRKTLLTHMRIRHPKAKELLKKVHNETENQQCCTVCQRKFVNRKTLLTHVQMQHPEANDLFSVQSQSKEKTHCCTICQRRFIYKNTLLTHMRKRHPKANEQLSNTQSNGLEKLHCCDICQRRFVYKKSLISHMRKHLGNKSDTQFSHMRLRRQKVNELKQQLTHNQDLSAEKPHCCKFCQRRFVYRKTLITHMRKHLGSKQGTDSTKLCNIATEQQDLINEKAQCCTFCQRRFVYRKTLITHMRKHLGRKRGTGITKPSSLATQQEDLGHGKPHCCKFCQRRFVYRKTLITHIQQEHQKVNEQSQNQDLTKDQEANESNKQQITSSSNSTKPEQDQVKEKPHCCSICQKRFVYEKVLLTHMQQHTENKQNNPLIPPSSISVNTEFSSNDQTHTQQKLYTCDICEKQFAHKENLDNHLRLHSAVKPYWCNVCNKRFTELNALNAHTQIHTSGNSLDDSTDNHTIEKPYSCNLCREQFEDLGVLIDHARQFHTDEKSFRCKIKNVTN